MRAMDSQDRIAKIGVIMCALYCAVDVRQLLDGYILHMLLSHRLQLPIGPKVVPFRGSYLEF